MGLLQMPYLKKQVCYINLRGLKIKKMRQIEFNNFKMSSQIP